MLDTSDIVLPDEDDIIIPQADPLLADPPEHVSNAPFSQVGEAHAEGRIFPKHRVILAKLKDGIPVAQALVEAGYSMDTAVNKGMGALTHTKSWLNLMDEYVSEEKLAMRHNELLDLRVQKPVRDPLTGKVTHYISVPDAGAVSRAIEMGYKLRGAFKEAAPAPKSQHIYNLFYKPEVRAAVKAFEDNLKTMMFNDTKQDPLEDGDVSPATPSDSDTGGGTTTDATIHDIG